MVFIFVLTLWVRYLCGRCLLTLIGQIFVKKKFWVCFEDIEYELNISNNFRLLDQGVSYLKGFGLHFFEKPICKFDFDLAKLFIFFPTLKKIGQNCNFLLTLALFHDSTYMFSNLAINRKACQKGKSNVSNAQCFCQKICTMHSLYVKLVS